MHVCVLVWRVFCVRGRQTSGVLSNTLNNSVCCMLLWRKFFFFFFFFCKWNLHETLPWSRGRGVLPSVTGFRETGVWKHCLGALPSSVEVNVSAVVSLILFLEGVTSAPQRGWRGWSCGTGHECYQAESLTFPTLTQPVKKMFYFVQIVVWKKMFSSDSCFTINYFICSILSKA